MADGDKDVDGRYVKSTVSLSKKKMSKVLQSRVSLKKFSSNSQMSYASEASFVMKRQSDFDRSSSKVPRYQNSYRLDPQKPFNTCLVYREIAAVIDGLSLTQPYDDMLMMKMANSIAMDVRARVKTLSFDRYPEA
ncbi:UNVERIFIED_CONTAM: hypothetical protein PYX00_003933 [Menopon gallinae]|uniref:Uncharacterized protein n=1 Tax=Menopon gallinae TaxID=328185 RepID=A0AAW2I3G3_9NEOP